MTVQIATFDLPPVMKSEDCQQLAAFLKDHTDQPVTLNCAKVTRIGGQGAQIIAAHVKFRAGRACPLEFESPSEGFAGSLQLMGLDGLLAKDGVAA